MTDLVRDPKLEMLRGLAPVRRDYIVSGIEIRAAEDGGTTINFSGHASVTERAYPLYGGPEKGGWDETIVAGAFKRTLNQAGLDVPFLINHDGMNLARTTAGTLKLSEDKIGLKVDAILDTRVSVVNDLAILMETKAMDEMSFAFYVRDQQWLNADGEEVPWWDLTGIDRRIKEVDIHKGDVSAVNYGANPYTSSALRSLAGVVGRDESSIRRAIADLEGLLPSHITPEPEPIADPTPELMRMKLALQARRLGVAA